MSWSKNTRRKKEVSCAYRRAMHMYWVCEIAGFLILLLQKSTKNAAVYIFLLLQSVQRLRRYAIITYNVN